MWLCFILQIFGAFSCVLLRFPAFFCVLSVFVRFLSQGVCALGRIRAFSSVAFFCVCAVGHKGGVFLRPEHFDCVFLRHLRFPAFSVFEKIEVWFL
jgi:hypothetical protein